MGMACYKCVECGTFYKDKVLAAKCRAWCKKNPACNPALKKFALKNTVKVANKGKGIDGCTYC